MRAAGVNPPWMLVLTPGILRSAEAEFRRGGPAADQVIAAADAMLQVGPFSVMEKEALPPSGDKHDYMSLGTYWWPDPAKPDGTPYIRRDGHANPAIEAFDRPRLSQMADGVVVLAAAAHLAGDARHAARAAELLRVWFLDPATRMNPHLRYGQAIPGVCEGRCIGIIDSECLARIADAAVLLAKHPAWPQREQLGLRSWMAEYLDWLVTSPLGQAEAKEHNNHGTCYDVQVVALALHTGREDLARSVLAAVPERRIRSQIAVDGSQPHELARTKAWSYSLKNLFALLNLAGWGHRLGIDLWGYRSADGRGIAQAVEWMAPFASGERPWAHSEIGGFDGAPFLQALAVAGQLPGGQRYRDRLGDGHDEVCLHIVAHCPLGAAGTTGGRRGFH